MNKAPRSVLVVTLDQALSSAGNLLIALLVARVSSVSAFGVFALVLLAYAATLGISRTWCAEPHAILAPALAGTREGRRIVAVIAGVIVGAVAILAVAFWAVLTLWLGLSLTMADRLILVALPLLAVQDFLRYTAIAWSRALWALLADTFWFGAVAVTGGLAMLGVVDDSPRALVTAWCAAGVLSLLLLMPGLRVQDAVGAGSAVSVRAILRLGAPAAVEFTVLTGGFQAAFFIAAATLGASSVAGPRAGMMLFGVTTVLFMGISQGALPVLARRPQAAPRLTAYMQGLFVGATVALGVFFTLIPNELGVALLGSTWPETQNVLLAVAIYSGLIGIAVPALLRIRLEQASMYLLRRRLVMGLFIPLCAFIGARLGGNGFMWGLVAGQVVDTLIVQAVAVRRRKIGSAQADRRPG